MATKEAAPKRQEAFVVCLYPDVCLSPDKPAPYQILAYYSDMENASRNVRIGGVAATNKDSRIPRVYNNEPGTGGGVESGVNVGHCRPTEGWAATVNVHTVPLLRHGTEFDMNCDGPDGKANTKGKTVYQTGAPVARIKADGSIEGDANPPVQTTQEEKGWLSRAWAKTKELNSKYKILVRAAGAVQVAGGVMQMVAGVAGLAAPTGITQILGAVAVLHGADDAATGLMQLWTGEVQRTLTEQAATAAASALGASPALAQQIGAGVDMAAGMASPANAAKLATKLGVQEGAERAARELAEQEARELAEREAKELAEREAKELAEKEAKEAAEKEAKEKAEQEAKEKAEQEAKEKAEQEAKEKAEQEAKEKAEQEAKKEGAEVKGKPKGVCWAMAETVYAQAAVVAKRFQEMYWDHWDLFRKTVNPDGTPGEPLYHPKTGEKIGSWHGHKIKLQEEQGKLRTFIATYDRTKCKKPVIPEGIRKLATAPPPKKPGPNITVELPPLL